ncbi:PACE efflux transporter [Pseudodonghicola xiamenensis]|uniref:Membrane protein n=1 Tax=Pseudodonghicola xiamenensis TaxID=337702 RepID=A0A8J3H9X0_9RHOB|nr:PACE efflux transporter [Pseudodonghicola xiamenensis]GHG93709.1 membrane protein [Pseudodonghicola xiamenensis]
MRTTRDRIRHAILFELIALIIVTPLGGLIFGVEIGHFGVITVISATIAMIWNYIFNLGFDHGMLRVIGHTRKTLPVRIGHALLFEIGLLCLLVPFIAWYLGAPLLQALIMDVALSGFYVVYAIAFNWAYDTIYPIPALTAPD